jgi:hypothetical protein
MSTGLVWELEASSGRVYIHFDVNDHFLSLETFIRTADSARKIIEALDETFFASSLDFQLIVVPPAGGTFLTKLGLFLSAPAAVFAFLNSEVGGAYIEGLTGRPPADWAKSFGQDHRAFIDSATAPSNDENNDQDLENMNDAPPKAPMSDEEASCREAADIVIAMTRGILEKSQDELGKLDMDIGALPDAVDARADFFAACIEDGEVRGIGFSSDDDFPIPRNSFPARAQRPARKPKDDDPLEWFVSVESIYVTSPNWEQDDQRSRQWKGKDQNKRDCYFVIEDAEFWYKVKNKSLHVEVLDNLKVQWAHQNIEGRPKNRRVLRVLEFNGETLASPLHPEAVSAILGHFSDKEANIGQPTLFDR